MKVDHAVVSFTRSFSGRLTITADYSWCIGRMVLARLVVTQKHEEPPKNKENHDADRFHHWRLVDESLIPGRASDAAGEPDSQQNKGVAGQSEIGRCSGFSLQDSALADPKPKDAEVEGENQGATEAVESGKMPQ